MKFRHLLFLAAFLTAHTGGPLVSLSLAKDKQLWIEEDHPKAVIPEINLPSFAPAIDKLAASVVNIRTVGKTQKEGKEVFKGNRGQQFPFDLYQQYPRRRSQSSLGSGFVIHPDGYIVTNHHVIENTSKILVRFKDEKKTHEAELIGSDSKTDLALIKVDVGRKLPAAPLGDSASLKAGDWVIAIGNPFRLGHTATVGIVSATSRRIPGGKPYDNFIQTDASINPGNSGGPLFNSKGQVVGVNTAIFNPTRMGSFGFNIGIGFAIPINQVKDIISQVKEYGKVTRGWLGVMIQSVSEDVAEAMGLDQASGALVADVVGGSPAEKAEFKRGDVIVAFDGKRVLENDELPGLVAGTKVGSTVSVDVIRAGSKKTLRVTIAELKGEENSSADEPKEESKLGLSVQEITPDIARSLGLQDSKGIIITEVIPDTPGANAGLRRGDIILEVGSQLIDTIESFRKATKDLPPNSPLLLLVKRNNNTIFLTLKTE